MTSEINLKSNGGDSRRVNCHLMPCNIEHNGEAAVEKYFETSIRKDADENLLKCSFRGRPLIGRQVNLPKDYVAVNVLKETVLDGAGDQKTNQVWTIDKSFDGFTYWNWDKTPSANDKIQQTLNWLDIANAIG